VGKLLRRLAPRTLRGRIVVAYGLSLAIVMAAVLPLAYFGLIGQLRTAEAEEASTRLNDIAAAAVAGDLRPVAQDPYAQLLDAGGVVARSAAAPTTPVLTAAERTDVTHGKLLVRRAVPGLGADAWLAARQLRNGQVVVVGASLAAVDRAERRLLVGLAIVGPALLVILILPVRRLIGATLAPVGALTAEARTLTVADSSRRLPQPPGEDEIATLARTLNGMLDRIDAAYQRERSFVDDAAHELRTPVAVLRAELELGLAAEDPVSMRQALRVGLVEADRLSRLATDLLVLARARAGGLEVHRQPTDVTTEVRALARRLAELYGVPVEVSGPVLVADLDPVRLEQVVINLVGNAVQAGGHQIQVRVDQPSDDSIVLVVDDDGPGFPAPLLPVAFDRFSRGSTARTRDPSGGAGLGLAIVAAVAAAHGGHAEAANDSPLGGARVRVVLR
jgi:signal transduction histidine kinase